MLSLKQFLINVASNINTLQTNKVDMTTPAINLNTAAEAGSDDAELYDAIHYLGWDTGSDPVITNS